MQLFNEDGSLKRKEFSLSIRDVKRLVDSLEFTADFDKTDCYYEMKE